MLHQCRQYGVGQYDREGLVVAYLAPIRFLALCLGEPALA